MQAVAVEAAVSAAQNKFLEKVQATSLLPQLYFSAVLQARIAAQRISDRV
jgi:hypothetical protein